MTLDLFSWPPVAIASSITSVGVGMVNSQEFWKARVCFALTAILLFMPLVLGTRREWQRGNPMFVRTRS